jgi:hypothetical protein
MVGRVPGARLVGVDPEPVPEAEPDVPPGRRPNSPPATVLGTPWLVRHWVYFCRAAVREPSGVVVDGADVADDPEDADDDPPPQAATPAPSAPSATATARIRRVRPILGKTLGTG